MDKDLRYELFELLEEYENSRKRINVNVGKILTPLQILQETIKELSESIKGDVIMKKEFKVENISILIRYASSYSIGTMDIGMYLFLKKKNKLKRLFKDVDVTSVMIRDRYAYVKSLNITFTRDLKNNHFDEVTSLVESINNEINYLFPLSKDKYDNDMQLFIYEEFDKIKAGTLRRYNSLWCVTLKWHYVMTEWNIK